MRRLIFILCAMIGVSQAQTIQYIGAPTTTVISRGNFRTDSIFYLPKRTKLPTDTAALRYQISDSSLYAWTGSQWRKVGADADTLVYSTRAWRQKGDDSLAARINLKVNISDTASMLTPYLRKADTAAMLTPYYRSATASAALALKLNISDTSSMLTNYIRHAGYGLTKSGQSFLVDTLTISTRAWRQKGLDSLAALEVSGSGTTNYVPKFTAGSTIGNSQIFDDGTSVGVGTTSPNIYSSGAFKYLTVSNNAGGGYSFVTVAGGAGGGGEIDFGNQTIRHAAIASLDGSILGFYTNNTNSGTGVTERLRVFANGRIGVNTTTDAGYQFDINGTLRTVNGANFATSSGNVGVGTLADASDYRLQVKGPAAFGNGVTDNQVLIGFQQDLKFRYRQNISSAYGFVFDSANLESLVLTSFEGGNQQAFLLMGDGTSGNIFGFSHSVNSGSTFTADFVIDYNGIIGINTNQPNASAQLDVSSTTRGFLPPRMTTAQRDAISSPAAGLIIYNTSTSKLQVYTTSWTDLH